MHLPYAHVSTALSPVLPEAPEPTIKKRKRVDARQVEVLNRVYVRTT